MNNVGFKFSMEGPEQRTVSIETVEFFKGISKALIKVVAGNYTDALSEIPDIVSSLGLKATPQKRVGALVLRSLERALIFLVSEISKDRDEIKPDIHAASFSGLSNKLEFEVNRDFFENPISSGIVQYLEPDARKWLSILGLSSVDINNIVSRLSVIFSRSINEEWVSNSEYYKEILEIIDSPFTGAAIMEQEWSRYRYYLISVGEERVFDESFGLRQIYLQPRCYFYKKNEKFDNVNEFIDDDDDDLGDHLKILSWAHSEIESWISEQNKDSSIRTIAGGPGSGKSSFAKILAADLAILNKRVLFVPLHQIDLDVGIAKAISDYFKQSGHFSDDPLSYKSNELTILILDGLDEIQMQGRAAQESAQSFVNDLIRYIDRINTTSCKILCLITGRDLAVQSAEGFMENESQVLYLAPYSIPRKEKRYFLDNYNIVNIDQRNEWWNKYGILTGKEYKEIPKSLKEGELNEVTSQPLLNYLVALSYGRGIKLNKSTNINEVYKDLLEAVYARSWARHSHPTVKNVPYDYFIRLLEEVAISVWHGAGRTTTLSEVEFHCKQSKIGNLLSSFQSGISSGVSSLLLAFYFRQKGRRDDGSKTFEFTHKTFAEYLISLRVVRLFETISNQMEIHSSDPDLGIDEQDALHRWLNVCGQTAIDSYLLEFIRREVSFRNKKQASKLQKTLSNMLSYALRSGWPVQRIEKLSFSEQQSYVRNAEETLLACLNACARISQEITKISWPSETAAGEMILRLQGQRKGPPNKPVMKCLSYTCYDGQCFDMADLYKSEMNNSSFVMSKLKYTMMMYANISESSFVSASMDGININSANIKGSIFTINKLSPKFIVSIKNLIERNKTLNQGGEINDIWVDRFLKLGAVIFDLNSNKMSIKDILSRVRKIDTIENS